MANEFKIKKGLIVTGADGGTVVDIQGSQGQLFSVTDDLSGSIFAVSDISGVPILNVNSSGVSYFDGSLGIGTDNPDVKLWVNDTADGDKIRWGKDNVLVGSIGTYNGVPYIGYQGGTGGGIMFNGASIEPTLLGNSRSSNTNDIGSTTYRWKDGWFAGQVTAGEYNLPSGGILDWANGDARIVEGLVNNYSLSFQTWDGSNLNTALRLDGNNDATFAGGILLPEVTGRAIIIGGDTTLDAADASIYLGNSPSSYGFDITYKGTGSGNTNSLDIVSTNAGSPVTALSILQDGASTFVGTVTASTFLGDLNGTINTATTGVTQTAGDNSTLIATTAYADVAAAAVPIGDYLPLAGGTLTGDLTLTGSHTKVILDSSGHVNLELDRASTSYDANLLFKTGGAIKWRIWNDGSDNTLGIRDEVNGSEMVTFQTGGNVGIGTTSPRNNLDIALTGAEMVYPIATGASPTGGFRIGHTDTSWAGVELNMGIANASAQGYPAWIQAQNPADLSVSRNLLLNPNGGNVGIGTTNPTEALMVEGWIRVANNTGIKFNTSASSGDPTLNIDSSAHWNFLNTAGNNLLKIDNGGNVGIGTTSPDEKLDVAGKVQVTGSSLTVLNASDPVVTVSDTDTNYRGSMRWLSSSNVLEFFTRYAGTYYTNNLVLDRGNVGIGTSTPNAKLDVQGTQGQLFSVTDDLSGDIFSVADISGVPIMNVNSDGTSYFDGNVGIGIASPLQPLSIESSTSPLIKIRNTTNGEGAAIEFNDTSGSAATQNGRIVYRHSDSQSQGGGSTFELLGEDDQTLQVLNNGRIVVEKKGSATEVGYGFYNDVNTGMYTPGADTLALATGGSNRLHINSAGNVGIGTTSPGDKLNVEGNILLGTTDKIGWRYSSGDISYNYITGEDQILTLSGGTWTSSSTQTAVRIKTQQGEKLTIKNNGNVGIGTTSPSAKLEVMSSSQTLSTAKFDSIELQTYTVNNSWVGENLYYDGSFKYRADGYATALYFDTSGFDIRTAPSGTAGTVAPLTTRFTILESSGNVGIGTTSPPQKLAVIGNISLGNYNGSDFSRSIGINDSSGTYGNGSSYIKFNELSGSGTSGTTKGAAIEFHNHLYAGNTNQTMVIQADGNVGIGTTSPTDILDVNGTSIFRRDLTIYHKGNNSSPSYELRFKGTNSSGVDKVHASLESSPYATDTNAGTLLFKTANASNQILDTRMVIDGVGNVGIGTTSPAAKLEVYGSAPFIYITDDTETESGIIFRDIQAGLSQAAAIKFSSSDNKLRFYNNDTTAERMTIDTLGKVGIGVTSPSAIIHAVYSGLAAKFVSSQATGLEVQGGGNGQPIARFKDTAASEKVTISSTGNLGIGTTAPSQKLHVVGAGVFTSTVTATNFILSSDKRLKTKIVDLSCDNIDVSWKSFEMKDNEGEYRTGVIAQELEQNHPEFVNTDDKGFKSVKYIDLLIAKIAELEARLEKLEK